MTVDSIIVYRSFVNALRKIKDPTERCRAYDAMFDYGLDHIETELDDGAGIALEIIKPLLDTQIKNRIARSENGKKGGRPKQNQAEESEKKLDKAKDNLIGNCELIIDNHKKEINKEKRFTKPSLEEVKAYCLERNNNVDPNRFYSYYEANGWMVGRNKMKDFKAAIRLWERNGYSKPVQEDKLPVYDTKNNSSMDKSEEDELLKLMGRA